MDHLREYQVKGVDQLALKVARGRRKVVFQLATGGGKTVVFSALSKRFLDKQGKKIVIFVHREELLKQAFKALFHWHEIVAFPVTAGSAHFTNAKANVAMVETANNRLKKNPGYFGEVGLVIVDECHIGNFKKLYDYFPDSVIIGFTATPIAATKNDPLKNYFEDIVCGIDIPQLIELWRQDHTTGLVPNKTICASSVKRSSISVKNGEFDDRQMAEEYMHTKHVQNCLAAYNRFCAGKKTLVFNCNKAHSIRVHEVFTAFGLPSRYLDDDTSETDRRKILEWYKTTPGAILHNIGVLTTGFDEPSIEAIIVNKSTLSLSLWLQMCGRGSRPFPGKEEFLIIDMGGNGAEHGDWSTPQDWEDLFHRPPEPGKGGEAPSKECKGCHVLIPITQVICPHCGAENRRKVVYDGGDLKYGAPGGRKGPDIYVEELNKEAREKDYKPVWVIHRIKMKVTSHAKYRWRIRQMDDKTAEQLQLIFLGKLEEWFQVAGIEERSQKWMAKKGVEWLYDDFKKTFNWEPTPLPAPAN